MTKLPRIALGAAALALVAAPLTVVSSAQAEILTVKASDLDLSSPAGQKQLEHRAEGVARDLCRGTYMPDVNCVPGVKAKIIAKATADGSVSIDRHGKSTTFLTASAPSASTPTPR